MDLFATCCAAAGVAAPAGVDGVSVLPTLLGQEQPLQRVEGVPRLADVLERVLHPDAVATHRVEQRLRLRLWELVPSPQQRDLLGGAAGSGHEVRIGIHG